MQTSKHIPGPRLSESATGDGWGHNGVVHFMGCVWCLIITCYEIIVTNDYCRRKLVSERDPDRLVGGQMQFGNNANEGTTKNPHPVICTGSSIIPETTEAGCHHRHRDARVRRCSCMGEGVPRPPRGFGFIRMHTPSKMQQQGAWRYRIVPAHIRTGANVRCTHHSRIRLEQRDFDFAQVPRVRAGGRTAMCPAPATARHITMPHPPTCPGPALGPASMGILSCIADAAPAKDKE